MRTAGLLLTIFLLLAAGVEPAQAEGWRDWVPFMGKDESAPPKKTKKAGSVRRPPWTGKSSKPPAEKPSMLSRMGSGTKQFFSRTKDALTWGDDSTQTKKGDGEHVSWNDPSPGKKKEEKPSAWTSWWRRDETRPSATVEDFMRQERPERAP